MMEKTFPNFKALLNSSCISYEDIRTSYEQYVSRISTDDSAISLELAIFLIVLCNATKPQRILDLGSGFSSFVFRRYQLSADPKPEVWSVDDCPHWLNRTRSFLYEHNLNAHKLLSWDSFQSKTVNNYDLILHDLGTMDLRLETLEEVLGMVCPCGLVILDDFHKPKYKQRLDDMISQFKFEIYNLGAFTMDKYGRYSALLTDVEFRKDLLTTSETVRSHGRK